MKDIFSYNADIDKNAYLNWRSNRHDHMHNRMVIAEGFMSSDNRKTSVVIDCWVLPFLF